MTNQPPKEFGFHDVARVVHVERTTTRLTDVIVFVGDVEHQLTIYGTPVAPGDAFLVAMHNPITLGEKIGSASPDAWVGVTDATRWRIGNSTGQTRMHALWQRHIVRRAVRSYLDCAGFIEIDSPLLVHGSTPDAAIDSFAVMDRYLVTSTEYQIKRLEVGGFDRTYTLTQNYRFADHEGQFRNPEFTMLEWARVGQDLAMIEKDAEQMTWAAHLALGGSGQLSFSGHMIDLRPPWARMTVAEAIERFAGAALPDFSLSSILNAVQIAGITIDSASAHDIYFLFSLLMDHIQNQLGLTKPVFVTDWPAFETSSAREKSEGAIAERSEMFIAGIEISDGFPSLTDYDAQKRSFARQNARRHADGKAEVVVDDKYMESLRVGLPRGAGMALGFDRLVMVLTNRSSIRDVLAFAWDEV